VNILVRLTCSGLKVKQILQYCKKNKYEHAILSRFTGEAQQKTRSQLSEYWDMADLNMPVDKFIDAWIR
jgi:hypothetical protein